MTHRRTLELLGIATIRPVLDPAAEHADNSKRSQECHEHMSIDTRAARKRGSVRRAANRHLTRKGAFGNSSPSQLYYWASEPAQDRRLCGLRVLPCALRAPLFLAFPLRGLDADLLNKHKRMRPMRLRSV